MNKIAQHPIKLSHIFETEQNKMMIYIIHEPYSIEHKNYLNNNNKIFQISTE